MKVLVLFASLIPFSLSAQSTDSPKEINISMAASVEFQLDGSPDFIARDGDDVWIQNTNRIEKLSAKNKTAILIVPIPNACGALVVGFNSVWVATCKEPSVYRVDSKTGKIITKIPTGISDDDGEISLAAGDGAVWILSDKKGILSRINAETNKVEALIAVLPESYCGAYGYNSVWVTNTNANSVQRIDPSTNKVVSTIPVGSTPRFLAAGEGGIWALNQGDGTVSHINPDSNSVVSIDAKAAGTGGDIDAGAGFVWVRGKNKLLLKINPLNNKVETVYTPSAGSGAVRVAGRFIWVTAHDINKVWVLDSEF